MFFSVAPLRSRFSDPNGLQREGRPETGQWRSSSLAQLHFMRKPSQCRSACIRTMNSSRGPGKAGAVSLGTVEPSAGRFPQSQLHQGPAPLGSPQGFDPTPPETAGPSQKCHPTDQPGNPPQQAHIQGSCAGDAKWCPQLTELFLAHPGGLTHTLTQSGFQRGAGGPGRHPQARSQAPGPGRSRPVSLQ